MVSSESNTIEDADSQALDARVFLLASRPVINHWQDVWNRSSPDEIDFLATRRLTEQMRAETIQDLEDDGPRPRWRRWIRR